MTWMNKVRRPEDVKDVEELVNWMQGARFDYWDEDEWTEEEIAELYESIHDCSSCGEWVEAGTQDNEGLCEDCQCEDDEE